MKIVIKELPEYEVASIRRTGSYFEPQDHSKRGWVPFGRPEGTQPF